MPTKIPRAFTKTNDTFSKASASDNVLANNPGYYRRDVTLATVGQLVYIYESNDVQIAATNLGVTAAREEGRITITVPRETYLFAVRCFGVSRDTDSDDIMRVQFNYTYSGPDNAYLEGMEPVGLTVWDYSLISNSGEEQSETYFAAKVDKIWNCTIVDTGVDSVITLEVKVEDMNYDNWKINIGF